MNADIVFKDINIAMQPEVFPNRSRTNGPRISVNNHNLTFENVTTLLTKDQKDERPTLVIGYAEGEVKVLTRGHRGLSSEVPRIENSEAASTIKIYNTSFADDLENSAIFEDIITGNGDGSKKNTPTTMILGYYTKSNKGIDLKGASKIDITTESNFISAYRNGENNSDDSIIRFGSKQPFEEKNDKPRSFDNIYIDNIKNIEVNKNFSAHEDSHIVTKNFVVNDGANVSFSEVKEKMKINNFVVKEESTLHLPLLKEILEIDKATVEKEMKLEWKVDISAVTGGDIIVKVHEGKLTYSSDNTNKFNKARIEEVAEDQGHNYIFRVNVPITLVYVEKVEEGSEVVREKEVAEQPNIVYRDYKLKSYFADIFDEFRKTESLKDYILEYNSNSEDDGYNGMEELFEKENDIYPNKIKVYVKKVGKLRIHNEDGSVVETPYTVKILDNKQEASYELPKDKFGYYAIKNNDREWEIPEKDYSQILDGAERFSDVDVYYHHKKANLRFKLSNNSEDKYLLEKAEVKYTADELDTYIETVMEKLRTDERLKNYVLDLQENKLTGSIGDFDSIYPTLTEEEEANLGYEDYDKMYITINLREVGKLHVPTATGVEVVPYNIDNSVAKQRVYYNISPKEGAYYRLHDNNDNLEFAKDYEIDANMRTQDLYLDYYVENRKENPIVKYVADEKLEAGIEEVRDEGRPEVVIKTTAYIINNNGEVEKKELDDKKEEGKEKIVAVGVKPKVITEKIPFVTIYKENPEKDFGDNTETGGVDGTITKTINYTLDKKSGKVIASEPVLKVVRPTDHIITFGTKPKVEMTAEKLVIKYEADETAEARSRKIIQGTPKITKKITTYTLNKQTGKITSSEKEETIEGVPTIIKVGTKPKVEEEVLDYTTNYIADENLEVGEKQEITAGKKGLKTTTTTYTFDSTIGMALENDPVEKIENPTTRIVKVGTKSKVETTPFKIMYIADPNRETTSEVIVQSGKDKVVKTTYKLDPTNGNISEEIVIQEGEDKVVIKGTKTKVTKEKIPFKVRYEEDSRLKFGTKIATIGKDGEKVTTVTYTLDTTSGIVTANEPKIEISSAQDVVISIGNIEKEVVNVPVTTKYIEDKSLLRGESITTLGEAGREEIITTYEVSKEGTLVNPTTTKKIITPMKEAIVRYGTKVEVAPSEEELPLLKTTRHLIAETTTEISLSEEGEKDYKDGTISHDGANYYYASTQKDENTGITTHYYKRGGSVVVNYISTTGEKLKDEQIGQNAAGDIRDVKEGTAYNFENDVHMRPLNLYLGKRTFRLVEEAGVVLQKAYNEKGYVTAEGYAAQSGKVQSGKTQNVTFVYKELLGGIRVKYYDSNWNEISGITTGIAKKEVNEEERVVDDKGREIKDVSLGTSYDASTLRAETITTKEGDKYYYLRTEGEKEKGEIAVDADLEVAYLYEKGGSVVVNYISTDGTNLLPEKFVVNSEGEKLEKVRSGAQYDVTTSTYKIPALVANGKLYKLVTGEEANGVTTPAAFSNIEKLRYENSVVTKTDTLINERKGRKYATTTGSVEAGKTLDITYVYKEVPLPESKVEKEKIPYTTIYIADSEKDFGDNTETGGVDGEKVTTTTYVLDEKTATIVEKITESSTLMQPKIIKRGTKAKVETTPFKIMYIADPNRETTSEVIVQSGKDKVVKTTYKLDPTNGNISEEIVIQEGEDKVVIKGTKTKVAKEKIPFKVRYEADNRLKFGTKIATIGKDGEKVTTVTYTLDTTSGIVTANEPKIEISSAQDVVISIGNIEKEVVNIPVTTKYIEDKSLLRGESITTLGEAGREEIITTYEVSKEGTLVNPTTTKKIITPMKEAIVRYGTKVEVAPTTEALSEFPLDQVPQYHEVPSEAPREETLPELPLDQVPQYHEVPNEAPTTEELPELPLDQVPQYHEVPNEAPTTEELPELPLDQVPQYHEVPREAPTTEELPEFPIDQVPQYHEVPSEAPREETLPELPLDQVPQYHEVPNEAPTTEELPEFPFDQVPQYHEVPSEAPREETLPEMPLDKVPQYHENGEVATEEELPEMPLDQVPQYHEVPNEAPTTEELPELPLDQVPQYHENGEVAIAEELPELPLDQVPQYHEVPREAPTTEELPEMPLDQVPQYHEVPSEAPTTEELPELPLDKVPQYHEVPKVEPVIEELPTFEYSKPSEISEKLGENDVVTLHKNKLPKTQSTSFAPLLALSLLMIKRRKTTK